MSNPDTKDADASVSAVVSNDSPPLVSIHEEEEAEIPVVERETTTTGTPSPGIAEMTGSAPPVTKKSVQFNDNFEEGDEPLLVDSSPQSLQEASPRLTIEVQTEMADALNDGGIIEVKDQELTDGKARVRNSCCRGCWYSFSKWWTDVFKYLSTPKQVLLDMVIYLFQTNFFTMFLIFAIFYFFLIIVFGALIVILSTFEGECIRVGDADITDFDINRFPQAFSLSWTTFSTVGYGNTWPALTKETNKACVGTQIILIGEAFLGIIFAGACSAIMFGKIVRMQSEALVRFSEVMVIRYGSGLTDKKSNAENADDSDEEQEMDKNHVPCPLLKFRLINDLHKMKHGVLTGCELKCVVSVKVDSITEHKTDNEKIVNKAESLVDDSKGGPSNILKKKKIKGKKHTSEVIPKRMFRTMKLVTEEHPFLKRAWTGVHVLNEESPLLTPKLRKRIARNGGFWPKKYNNIEKIKKNLDFYQIIISFSGTSKISGSTVYKQKIYDRVDIVVGYQFVDVLTKKKGKITVEESFLSDVKFQQGPDPAENLDNSDKNEEDVI